MYRIKYQRLFSAVVVVVPGGGNRQLCSRCHVCSLGYKLKQALLRIHCDYHRRRIFCLMHIPINDVEVAYLELKALSFD